MEKRIEILRDRVYRFVLKFVKDPDLADDLTQDIMLKVWTYKEKILASESSDFYVLKMAKNAVIDHFKKLSREKSYQTQVWLHIQKAENPTENDLRAKEMENRLEDILQKLPFRQQQVFHLQYAKQLSIKEISKELKIAPNTAKNHLFRALKVIRSHIKPELFGFLILSAMG